MLVSFPFTGDQHVSSSCKPMSGTSNFAQPCQVETKLRLGTVGGSYLDYCLPGG